MDGRAILMDVIVEPYSIIDLLKDLFSRPIVLAVCLFVLVLLIAAVVVTIVLVRRSTRNKTLSVDPTVPSKRDKKP